MTQPDAPAEQHEINVRWTDPAPFLAQALALEPLDYLKRLASGEFPRSPIAALMGIERMEVEEGVIRFEATAGPQHLNPVGLVHGGLVATLLDSALGTAVHSTLARGGAYSTVQLNVHYVRAVRPGERLVCEARVVHRGRTIATAEGTVRGNRGRVVAHGSTTCSVVPPRSAPAA